MTSSGMIRFWRCSVGKLDGPPLRLRSARRQVDPEPAGARPLGKPSRYHRIGHDGEAIERLFVDLFLEAHARTPKQITLDLDATDDPIHGHQEGRFFHGYYDCHCYLPLYVFCGRHLLAAKLRRSNIDASAGAVEEVARIVARSGRGGRGFAFCCGPTPGLLARR